MLGVDSSVGPSRTGRCPGKKEGRAFLKSLGSEVKKLERNSRRSRVDKEESRGIFE